MAKAVGSFAKAAGENTGEEKSDYSEYSGSSDASSSYTGSDSDYDSADATPRDRKAAAGRQGPPRQIIRVMLEGAGPMELKNTPARLVVWPGRYRSPRHLIHF